VTLLALTAKAKISYPINPDEKASAFIRGSYDGVLDES